MAAIKQSELRLLVVFGILIFGAVTFFALEVVNGKKNDAIGLQRSYANKIREYNDLISQKEQWEVKRDFIQQYQPVYRTEEQEAPAIEAYFRSAAQGEGVEIKTLRPMPPEPLGNSIMAISLEAKVTGPGPDIMRFLIQLQAENRFYAIPSISIAADRKDPSVVTADMIFSRWFTLNGQAPPVEEPGQAPPMEEPEPEVSKPSTGTAPAPKPGLPEPVMPTGGKGAAMAPPAAESEAGSADEAEGADAADATGDEPQDGGATTAPSGAAGADQEAAEEPPTGDEPEENQP
ncbi:MAG: hypothetical protein ACR2RV_00685 [Verrucomicrobiales bacterium]